MFRWRKWKQKMIKKLKLRTIMLCPLVIIMTVFLLINGERAFALQINQYDDQTLSKIYENHQAIRVIIHRSYICGDEVEEIGRLTYEDSLVLLMENPHLELTTDDKHSFIRLVEKIDDLSSYCKENAYFGVSKIGDLSLFDGLPKYEKVMKTFFQLNIPYMESMLNKDDLEQLLSGIKVNDVDEYESVLATFSEYSVERTDTVRRPYY